MDERWDMRGCLTSVENIEQRWLENDVRSVGTSRTGKTPRSMDVFGLAPNPYTVTRESIDFVYGTYLSP
jgi:hypothetical protein